MNLFSSSLSEHSIAIVGDIHLTDRTPRSRKDDFLLTALDKLDSILDLHDCIILLGDVFNSPTTSLLALNKIIDLLTKHRDKSIYTILGNHDLFHMNESALEKTALGLLNKIGLIKIIRTPLTISNLTFHTIPLSMDLSSIEIDTENKNVLLGHCFYEYALDPENSITTDDITKLNYKHIFLGHDHCPYDDLRIGNSILHRGGSLLRTDSQQYNKDRVPSYYVFEWRNSVNPSLYAMKVNCKPSYDIYNEGAFRKKEKIIDLSMLKEVLSTFQRGSVDTLTIIKTLTDMGIDNKSFQYLKELHLANDLNFS